MKALLINSSSRVTGNTSIALEVYKQELESVGYSVSEINLSTKVIKTCLGCRICFDKGEDLCPLKDDINNIFNNLVSSDLLLLASPVYVEDINGIMKNWIDRMAFNCHRPAFYEKSAYVLCTSGTGSSNHGLATMERALQTWGFNLVGKAKYITGAKAEPEEFKEKYLSKIRRECEKIGREIELRHEPSFLSVMTYEIQKMYYQKSKQKNYDYTFWEQKGWLGKNNHYYTCNKVGIVKSQIAIIVGKFIASIVLK
jgi:multimeric flavodoxin WrbA